jgi:hypothetical protein
MSNLPLNILPPCREEDGTFVTCSSCGAIVRFNEAEFDGAGMVCMECIDKSMPEEVRMPCPNCNGYGWTIVTGCCLHSLDGVCCGNMISFRMQCEYCKGCGYIEEHFKEIKG